MWRERNQMMLIFQTMMHHLRDEPIVNGSIALVKGMQNFAIESGDERISGGFKSVFLDDSIEGHTNIVWQRIQGEKA